MSAAIERNWRTALECRASAKSTASRGGALPIPIAIAVCALHESLP